MNLVKITELFDIQYGNQFDLNKMEVVNHVNAEYVNFISRTAKKNGVAAKVKKIIKKDPFPKGYLTVALGGSILSTFVQPQPFYTGQNIAVLKPKQNLTDNEKLYYCQALKQNDFRYTACGREANRTLKDLLIPARSEIPDWVNKTDINKFDNAFQTFSGKIPLGLNKNNWSWF